MSRYRIVHRSVYRFAKACNPAPRVQLRPFDSNRQRTVFFQLTTRPLAASETAFRDLDANDCSRLRFAAPLHTLAITATSVVDRRDRDEVAGSLAEVADALGAPWTTMGSAGDRYRKDSPRVEVAAFAERAREVFGPGGCLREVVERLIENIHRDLVYARTTNVTTTATEALRSGRGQCQDFAHVAIGTLRAAGIPARYVGGHWLAAPRELHAWVSIQTPRGWLDIDPTRRVIDPRDHLTVAIGRDRHDVSPIEGAGDARLDLAIQVEPISEAG